MPDRASALVTIHFTDLVASAELLSRAGDEDAQRIFRAHHQLLAETAAAHGGAELNWLGDGLMVAFGSGRDDYFGTPMVVARLVPSPELLFTNNQF
jgi:class 3 adenylate cyclase